MFRAKNRYFFALRDSDFPISTVIKLRNLNIVCIICTIWERWLIWPFSIEDTSFFTKTHFKSLIIRSHGDP